MTIFVGCYAGGKIDLLPTPFLEYALDPAWAPCERGVSSLLNAAILKTQRCGTEQQLMHHFSELNLCSALQNNLDKNEFVTPTPVQAQAIPPLMEGRDVVATAQTDTGKTLAFSIPVVEALAAVPRTKTIKVLILSPTRELAIQIDAAFRQLADGMRIRTAVVVGGMSETNQLRDIQAGAEVVI
jgi:superfamily II DNA/RNA helicase